MLFCFIWFWYLYLSVMHWKKICFFQLLSRFALKNKIEFKELELPEVWVMLLRGTVKDFFTPIQSWTKNKQRQLWTSKLLCKVNCLWGIVTGTCWYCAWYPKQHKRCRAALPQTRIGWHDLFLYPAGRWLDDSCKPLNWEDISELSPTGGQLKTCWKSRNQTGSAGF